MESLLVWISIILGVASATLAITAFIFGWASYSNTAKLQNNIQALLAMIREKVEVVVERTTHQIDKAWDYFTSGGPIGISDDAKKEREELREGLKEEMKEEARREAAEAIKEAGLDPQQVKALLSRVDSLIEKTTVRTEVMVGQQKFLGVMTNIENEARTLAQAVGMKRFSKAPLIELGRSLYRADIIPGGAYGEIKWLHDVRNKFVHEEPEEIKSIDIDEAIQRAKRFLGYLKDKVLRFR